MKRILKHKIFLNYLIFFMILFVGRSGHSQDPNVNVWPQFRGINCSGVAHHDQKPPIDLESPGKIIWKTPVISGASSPCIWADKIFLTGFDEEKQQLLVLCINRLNGELIWKRIVPAKEIEPYHRVGSPADATPVTDGERVYVHFGSYGILCYDFVGNVVWTKEITVNADRFGSGTSPILSDNLVIMLVRRLSTNERYLLALDKSSGEEVWKHDLIEAGYSTPVIWGNDVVIHCEGFVSGYSLTDGSRSWLMLVRTHGESTPVVQNNMLYVNTWHYLGHFGFIDEIPTLDEFLLKYDKNTDLLISKEEFSGKLFMAGQSDIEDASIGPGTAHENIWNWFDYDKNSFLDKVELERYLNFFIAIEMGILAIKPGGKGDISSSHVLWRETENVAEVPSPICYKDHVYVVKNGGYFSCVDALTGRLIYKTRIKGTGAYFSSPIAANDKVYVAAHNGKVIVFQAGDEMTILMENNLGEKILATPAVVDNKLYLRTDKHLYAFGD
jgi:outer membrane protein assembly factor BamB